MTAKLVSFSIKEGKAKDEGKSQKQQSQRSLRLNLGKDT
jgi:hypothetical protein